MRLIALAPLLAVIVLGGCSERAAERAVVASLGDREARFQAVRDRGDFVCGEVNAMASMDRQGYSRFVYDERIGAALVDPRLDTERPSIASVDSACRKPEAYRSVDERLNCAAVPDIQADHRRQQDFETLWRQACI